MRKDTKHLPEGVRANLSTRLLTGRLPEGHVDAVLELLGESAPNGTTVDEVHPELAPDDEAELVSRSWAKTHR